MGHNAEKHDNVVSIDVARRGRAALRVVDPDRVCPRAVGDPGPCPFITCRKHLWMDAHDGDVAGLEREERWAEHYEAQIDPALRALLLLEEGERSILVEQLDAMPDTCAVDVAIRERGRTLDSVGTEVGVSRERVRQIELREFRRLAGKPEVQAMRRDYIDGPERYTKPVERGEDLEYGDSKVLDARLNQVAPPVDPGTSAWRGHRPITSPLRLAAYAFIREVGVTCATEIQASCPGFRTRHEADEVVRRLKNAGLIELAGVRGLYRCVGSTAEPTEEQLRQAHERAARTALKRHATRRAAAAGGSQ